jgi:hypothetical protein
VHRIWSRVVPGVAIALLPALVTAVPRAPVTSEARVVPVRQTVALDRIGFAGTPPAAAPARAPGAYLAGGPHAAAHRDRDRLQALHAGWLSGVPIASQNQPAPVATMTRYGPSASILTVIVPAAPATPVTASTTPAGPAHDDLHLTIGQVTRTLQVTTGTITQ